MKSILTPAVQGALRHGVEGAVPRSVFGDAVVAKAQGQKVTKAVIDRLYELYLAGKIGMP